MIGVRSVQFRATVYSTNPRNHSKNAACRPRNTLRVNRFLAISDFDAISQTPMILTTKWTAATTEMEASLGKFT
ncbi:hypothetical protein SLA2020_267200 [Shorea laevis]